MVWITASIAWFLMVLSGSAWGASTLTSSSHDLVAGMSAEGARKPSAYAAAVLRAMPADELLCSARQACSENNTGALYGTIGTEVTRRLKDGQLEPRRLLIALIAADGGNLYKYFLLLTLNATSQSWTLDAKRDVFFAAREYIDRARSPLPEKRLAAIATSNSMMGELVTHNRAGLSACQDYGNQLIQLAANWSEDPALRRAAVLGMYDMRIHAAVPELIALLADERILEVSPLAGSVCITLL